VSGRSSTIKVSDDAELLRYMRERLGYDPTTGALTRKDGFTGVAAGQRVGSVDSTGKRQAAFLGKRYQVAHLVWLWETGALPRTRLRKKNEDPLDDRFENLTTEPAHQEPDRAALQESFLTKARAKFGAALGLDEVAYVNGETPVRVTCGKHGPFVRRPDRLLASSHGCSRCCQEHAVALVKKTPEAKQATRKAYVEANPELYRAAQKRFRESLKVNDPEAYRAVVERATKASRAWAKTARGRAALLLMKQRRRARLKDACSPGVTPEQWAAICDEYRLENGDVQCAYCKGSCGARPTVEHVVPIVRGGLDEPSNVVPACVSCNSSKGARLVSEWPRAPHLLTKQEIAAFSDNAHLRAPRARLTRETNDTACLMPHG